jgi:hypothetical protein
VWWYTPVSQQWGWGKRRLRQKDLEFEARLGYIMKP